MSREALSLALVATLLAATGIGALAYMNGMAGMGAHQEYGRQAPMGGMMGSGGHQGGGMGCMMEHEDGDEETMHQGNWRMGQHGMMWQMQEHCREEMEEMFGGEISTVVINGTIVEVDNTTGIVVLETANGSVSLKIVHMYVDVDNGYMVYGPWLTTQLVPGSTVEAVIPAGQAMNGVVPALGISTSSGTYLVPPLVGR